MSSVARYSIGADSSRRKIRLNGSDGIVCTIASKSVVKIPATYIVCGCGNYITFDCDMVSQIICVMISSGKRIHTGFGGKPEKLLTMNL